MEDFDLIEQCVVVISGFAVSPTPMSMPTLYSNEYLTEEKLWKQWKEQEERYFALGGLVSRMKELTARAGMKWTPKPETAIT